MLTLIADVLHLQRKFRKQFYEYSIYNIGVLEYSIYNIGVLEYKRNHAGADIYKIFITLDGALSIKFIYKVCKRLYLYFEQLHQPPSPITHPNHLSFCAYVSWWINYCHKGKAQKEYKIKGKDFSWLQVCMTAETVI